MSNTHGNLSINSENIFPIIKKWLYSDHDIFLRELVSNGCDAITKLKKLSLIGEYEMPDDYEPEVHVVYDPEQKTLQIIDNGLGMDAAEIEEYINQIAFSGATDFLEKYKDKASEEQIIGHFGLGFYSAFMVADAVHIDSLSYREGAQAVHWECDGGTEFDMTDGDRTETGTKITLFLNEDCLEFSNEYRLREVLDKYCSFMPVPIYLEKENAEPEYETIPADEVTEKDTVIETIIEEAKTEEKENENGEKEIVEVSPRTEKAKILKRPVPINDIHPLWTNQPSTCTDDQYKEFYRKVFHDYKEPLFWIHLNMDYPFNLKGILYFPKLNLKFESAEGTIKLYNNQVFIADNIKEVIPDFLMLLKGVIDCPDLPLNVSRSALQNDGFVKKINDYITKKVADKLSGMCKVEKENYEKYWDDISPFIKYGCLRDEKFCDRMNDYILFKDINDAYITLPELLKKKDSEKDKAEDAKDEAGADKEPERETVYYVTDRNQQGQYINMFRENGMNAVILDTDIDSAFITQLEMRNQTYAFKRIDADITDALTEELSEEDSRAALDALSDMFRKALGKEELTIEVTRLKDEGVAAIMTISEEGRRMQDMMRMYSMPGMDESMFGNQETLTLNVASPLVDYLFKNPESAHTEDFCKQIYDLAKISNQPLKPEEMAAFAARTNKIMLLLAGQGKADA